MFSGESSVQAGAGSGASAKTIADRPRVVIVGGGFGGLAAAKALRGAGTRITIVDRRNHHLFQPLLYQVATAGLSPANIAAPIRRIFRRRPDVEVRFDEVVGIDAAGKRLALRESGELEFDYLILAAGATHSYFGHDDWEAVAPGLKTLEDALTIRRRVLLAFERAEREDSESARRRLLTFVVVGGGPTGVEMAGAIAELAKRALAGDFRRIHTGDARVLLLEGSDRVLPSFPPELSASARRQLEALGVEVRTGERVVAIDATSARVARGDGSLETIETETVVWGAGVAGSPLGKALGAGVELDRAGRVVVGADLTAPGHPDIFVIGDMAAVRNADGSTAPGVAPAAIQGGSYAADVIRRRIRGRRAPGPFRYFDKGSLATIGRSSAVGHVGRFRFSGWPAWFVWCFIHVIFLVGFRNRFAVLTEWAWSYFTYERGARLITEAAAPDARPTSAPTGESGAPAAAALSGA